MRWSQSLGRGYGDTSIYLDPVWDECIWDKFCRNEPPGWTRRVQNDHWSLRSCVLIVAFHFRGHMPAPEQLNRLYLQKTRKIDFFQRKSQNTRKPLVWFISKKCSDWADFWCVSYPRLVIRFPGKARPVARCVVHRDVSDRAQGSGILENSTSCVNYSTEEKRGQRLGKAFNRLP